MNTYPLDIYFNEGDRIENPGFNGCWNFDSDYVGTAHNDNDVKVLIARYIADLPDLERYSDLPKSMEEVTTHLYEFDSNNWRDTKVTLHAAITHNYYRHSVFVSNNMEFSF
jgi:hypothetical protein